MIDTPVSASFRDPSGFVFVRDDEILRQVNDCYAADYDQLIQSGLYEELVDEGSLVAHEELQLSQSASPGAYAVLQPERVPFISYPYEWCFGQLQSAALLTLDIQRRAFDHGMVLKDASAFNVQFVGSKPVFIDTLSFEIYKEGEPWVAYRQFCQHFLAPLALLAYVDIQLGNLQRLHIDGVPLDLAARLLPRRTRWKPSLFLHLHMHSWSQKRAAKPAAKANSKKKFGQNAMRGLIDNLQSTVKRLKPHRQNTTWEAYYGNTNYSSSAEQHKEALIEQFVQTTQPTKVWDLGANSGKFSEIAAKHAEHVVAFDYDQSCVEQLHEQTSDKVLPLIMDLSNPSPALGWRHQERSSLSERRNVAFELRVAFTV